MSPNDFVGCFLINKNCHGWWIAYTDGGSNDSKVMYFHHGEWYTSMVYNISEDSKSSYFDTKEAALEEFFALYPDKEIIDNSQCPHAILQKPKKTWRELPPLL